MKLDDSERKRVRDAIEKVEKKTSAEIFAVFARRSDDYRLIAAFIFSLWIFVVSLAIGIYFSWHYFWQAPQIALWQFVLAQLLALTSFMIVVFLFPKFAIFITPQSILRARAHQNAIKQFLAHGIDNTSERSGVLVFVSLDEHFAEILVDRAVEEKCGREAFMEIIPDLVEHCREGEIITGYIKTINAIGAVLEKSFPPQKKKTNELDDRLVII